MLDIRRLADGGFEGSGAALLSSTPLARGLRSSVRHTNDRSAGVSTEADQRLWRRATGATAF